MATGRVSTANRVDDSANDRLLALTPFELYYLFDDRDDYPTTFPVDLTFRGQVDVAAFDRALDVALARHPLLRSRVEFCGRKAFWVPDNQTASFEQCTDLESLSPRIDVQASSRPKVAITFDQLSDQSRVRLFFHHACCDGLAAVQFVEDLLVSYHNVFSQDVASNEVRCRKVDPKRLLVRGDYGLTESGYKPNLRDNLRVARSCLSLASKPCLIAPGRKDVNKKSSSSRFFITRTVEPSLEAWLRAAATREGATLNDLLVRDLFLAIADWNTESKLRRPIRITIPTNLRLRKDHVMPAANVLSFAFLSRRKKQLEDHDQLLVSIRDQMNAIKEHRLGLYFVGGISFLHRWKLLRATLRSNRSFATAVLSNLGKVFTRCGLPKEGKYLRTGNLVFERFEGVPPIRPGTRASIAVISYADSMAINLRCDPHHFSDHDRDRFLDAYFQRLEQSADAS